MTRLSRPACCFALALALAAASAFPAKANTIAITEFIVNPWGTDLLEYEWIELFNYGPDAVNLADWTLKDNATTVFTLPSITIPSGGFVIAASSKSLFQERWLSGAEDDRVVGSVPFQMNNSQDGLYLRNAEGDLVWSLGYTTPGTYRATFLAVDDFSITDYGIPPQDNPLGAYVNRDGIDGSEIDGINLGLGYEGNEFTTDPFAYASAASNEENPTPEWGSPLLGQYTAVPEPASIALIGAAALLALPRRRRPIHA